MKRIGTLYRRPLIEGDENELTDNEILIKKNSSTGKITDILERTEDGTVKSIFRIDLPGFENVEDVVTDNCKIGIGTGAQSPIPIVTITKDNFDSLDKVYYIDRTSSSGFYIECSNIVYESIGLLYQIKAFLYMSNMGMTYKDSPVIKDTNKGTFYLEFTDFRVYKSLKSSEYIQFIVKD